MALSLLAFITALVVLGLRLADVWEKWRTRRLRLVVVPPHPLSADLQAIAAAIRHQTAVFSPEPEATDE